MRAGTTITVRGEGGAIWDEDVPEDGSVRRELLDDAIAAGRITVLNDPDPEVEDDETSGADGEVSTAEDGTPDGEPSTPLEDPAGDAEPAPEPPAKSGSKEEWVAYAVAKGADEAEARQLTRDALVELYG